MRNKDAFWNGAILGWFQGHAIVGTVCSLILFLLGNISGVIFLPAAIIGWIGWWRVNGLGLRL